MSQHPFDWVYAYPANYNVYPSEEDAQQEQDVTAYTLPHVANPAWTSSCGAYSRPWAMQSQAQWANEGIWCRQTMMSPSAMTSDTSNTESSSDYPFYLARSTSESTDYSEHWSQVASPTQTTVEYIQPQSELLSNVGSEFNNMAVAQIPPYGFPGLALPESSMQDLSDSEMTLVYATQGNTVAASNDHVDDSCKSFSETSATTDPHRPRRQQDSESRAKKRQRRTKGKPAVPVEKTRVFCDICRDSGSKDYSRGFRGEHELARHCSQKHSALREVWICVDQSPDHKLRNCERCQKQHPYGSEYGGAEHMRRKHTKIFGEEMMETLKGCTHRTALSMKRLKRAGWLKQVWVQGDVEVSDEHEEIPAAADGLRPLAPVRQENSQILPSEMVQHNAQGYGIYPYSMWTRPDWNAGPFIYE